MSVTIQSKYVYTHLKCNNRIVIKQKNLKMIHPNNTKEKKEKNQIKNSFLFPKQCTHISRKKLKLVVELARKHLSAFKNNNSLKLRFWSESIF